MKFELRNSFKVIDRLSSSQARYATAEPGDTITLVYPIEKKHYGREIKLYVNDEYKAYIGTYEAERLPSIYLLEEV